MARKQKIVTIKSDDRDNGKTFRIKEMPAVQAERWASHALHGMVKGGVDVPLEYFKSGMLGVYAMGMKAVLSIPPDLVDPLLDEMFECVVYIPDPKMSMEVFRLPTTDDIEEIQTIALLRSEVFELHTGFSVAGFLSRLISRLPAEGDDRSTTQTSNQSSETSSPAG